jgi:hypothetical protein
MNKAKTLALLALTLLLTTAYATPAFAQFEAEGSELKGTAEQPAAEVGEFRYPESGGTGEAKVHCNKVNGTWNLSGKISSQLKVTGIAYAECFANSANLKEAKAEVTCKELDATQEAKASGEGAVSKGTISGESPSECTVKIPAALCEIKVPAQAVGAEESESINKKIENTEFKHWLLWLLIHIKTIKATSNCLGLPTSTKVALLHLIVHLLHLHTA